MKLTIRLERVLQTSAFPGLFEARVVQGSERGSNLLSGRQLMDVESARDAAESEIRRQNPLLEPTITWEIKDRTTQP